MIAYVRPTIKAPVFRDPNGQVIDYGNRCSGEPPEDTYSVDTHPERFAPLHTVADALLSYLTSNFDVAVVEDMSVAHEFVHGRDDIIRAVRVTPALPSAAAVTLVYSSYPGVLLRVGRLAKGHFPDCGCDACDESWEETADRLEELVLAVVDGRFREHVEVPQNPWVTSAFTTAQGNESTRSDPPEVPSKGVRRSPDAHPGPLDGWAAWPRLDQSS